MCGLLPVHLPLAHMPPFSARCVGMFRTVITPTPNAAGPHSWACTRVREPEAVVMGWYKRIWRPRIAPSLHGIQPEPRRPSATVAGAVAVGLELEGMLRIASRCALPEALPAAPRCSCITCSPRLVPEVLSENVERESPRGRCRNASARRLPLSLSRRRDAMLVAKAATRMLRERGGGEWC
jgi:hypothetical protein